jgi:hypothetical protein
MLDLDSPNNPSTEIKYCKHCGTVNYKNIGQCKSCGRHDFISEEQFEKNRGQGRMEMIVGPMVFLGSLALLVLRYTSPRSDTSVPKWIMLPFVFLGLFIAVDGAVKYQTGRRNLTLNIVLGTCVLAIVAIQLYYGLY